MKILVKFQSSNLLLAEPLNDIKELKIFLAVKLAKVTFCLAPWILAWRFGIKM